jgi:predicted DNA-binding transcriptional regulator AlpA
LRRHYITSRNDMTALITTAQIAELLSVSREHVTDRLVKRPDFPKPRQNASRRMRKWAEAEVIAWASKRHTSLPAISSAVTL